MHKGNSRKRNDIKSSASHEMLLLSGCGVVRHIRRLILERAMFTLSKNVTRSQERGSAGGVSHMDLARACAGRGGGTSIAAEL